MPELILGPMLRYVDTTSATVWVETDAACEVEVLGHRARTFHVAGHHYALVAVTGLEPDSSTVYEVRLDGERRWPEDGADFPPSRIQTLPDSGRIEIAWGSCRVTAPHEPPHTLDEEDDERGRSKAIGWIARWLAHRAGVPDPSVRWTVLQQPTWRNQLGWLTVDGRHLELTIETTRGGPEPVLEVTLRHQLA
jgi:hypothetical protein